MGNRATLEIDGDISGLRAAFSAAREDSRRTSQALIEDSRRAGEVARAMWRSVQKQAVEALKAVRDAEESATSKSEEFAQRRKKVFEEETNYRTSAARGNADEAASSEERVTRSHEQGVARRKRATDDEARHAARAARAMQREWTRRGERAGGAAFQVLSQAGGQVLGDARSERERLAVTERLTGSAMFQAGARRVDVADATRTIQRFAADNGMDESEIAQALNAAQTEFSVLGDRTTSRGDRGRNLNRFLETARLARDTGNDVGEFARLQGLFSDTRIDNTTQRQLMLYAAGAAQRGAIEVGSITREAMPAMRAQLGAAIERARRSGGDPQAAARDAFVEMMSELEVARSAGENPRAAGNAIRDVSNALRSNTTQQNMLGNLRRSLGQNSALERTLFEADPAHRGQMRLRDQYTNALNLTTAFGEAGLGMTEFVNLTRGGGHGNPMSLLSNQRRVLGELLNADATGRKGYMRVRDLMNVRETALSEDDVRRGAEVFGGDTAAELAGNRARRGLGLTEHQVSGTVSAIDRFAAEHPMLAPLASAATSLAGEKAFQAIGGKLGGLLGPGGARAPGGLLGRVAGPVGAFFSTLLTPSNAGEEPYSDRAMIRAHGEAGGGRSGTEAALRAMQQAVSQGVREGMQQARVNATVTPHDAAHAASNNAGSRGGR